jgi:hypothetical protein
MKPLVDSCVARTLSIKAAAEGCVIITIDSDFGALIFRDGQARVVVLRLREGPALGRFPTFWNRDAICPMKWLTSKPMIAIPGKY